MNDPSLRLRSAAPRQPPGSSVMAHYSNIPRRQMEFSPTSPNYIPALRDTVTCVQARTVPHTTETGASLQRVRTGCFHLEVCAESCYLGRLGDDTHPSPVKSKPHPRRQRTSHRGADRRDFKERTAVGRGRVFPEGLPQRIGDGSDAESREHSNAGLPWT